MVEALNVRVPLDVGVDDDEGRELLCSAAARALGVARGQVGQVRVLRRSVDARRKGDVHFMATLEVGLLGDGLEERVLAGKTSCAPGVSVRRHVPFKALVVPRASCSGGPRPVVVGSGPAGLFCALYLARAGLRPLVLERGGDVGERLAAVAAFDAGGELDVSTNVQFGEGGAGMFSDGKLTTNIKSPFVGHVLRWFVDAGAPKEILWHAKPHIGTDRLVGVVRALRRQIEEAGGEVRFHAQVTGLRFDGTGVLQGLSTLDARTGAVEEVPARRAVLACGHSARDTFEALVAAGVELRQKPFSVGVRIEHPQSAVDRAQYGAAAGHPALGPADYKLAVHLPAAADGTPGRGVYTFCMCPGGQVVCAASEPGGVVVNGMSRFARDGENANSALLVGVGPADFDGDDALAGMRLQRDVERAAFQAALAAGGTAYQAPAQTVGDFLAGRAGGPSATVRPTYARGVAWADLHGCLPAFVTRALEEALPLLDRRMAGFADPQAVMCGVETRSSSPVRIVRDDALQARVSGAAPVGGSGLYPCGEGAGYAGGITSAACDGLRVAEAVASA